jgi:hypothetical protein
MHGTAALFVPSPGGWSVRVTFTRVPGRSCERLHTAIVDPANVALHLFHVFPVDGRRGGPRR